MVRWSVLAVLVVSSLLAACASASSGSTDGTSTRIMLRIKAPAYGAFGLGSTVFHFPSPLSAGERRRVSLTMTEPAPDELVVAAATVSPDGRAITVVAGAARRRSADRRRHGLSVEGSAAVQSGEVEGGEGYLLLGPTWAGSSSAAGHHRGEAPVLGTAPAGVSGARNAPACPAFERSLSRSLPPRLLSGTRLVRSPSRRLRDGSKAVDNRTPAGLALNQIVGELCRRDFKSAWLRAALSRR